VNNFDRNPTRVIFGASNSAQQPTAEQPQQPPRQAAPAASGQKRQ
jgi:phospholipid/cholesterol/gamma-HCH transport system substrate-binding protein